MKSTIMTRFGKKYGGLAASNSQKRWQTAWLFPPDLTFWMVAPGQARLAVSWQQSTNGMFCRSRSILNMCPQSSARRYISKFAKPGGLIGIVVPGIKEEFNDKPPEHLRVCWEWDFCSFHGPQWWRRHWDKSGKVAVEVSDLVPDGWHHWFTWDGVLEGTEKRWLEMLQEDAGCNLGFTRLVASRR